jgi:predicted small secreted protein
MLKKILFCVMSLLSLGLSACNTVEGAGRDVEHLGRDIHDEAQEHKRY